MEKETLLHFFVHKLLKRGVLENWQAFGKDFMAGPDMVEHSFKYNFSRLKKDPRDILTNKNVALGGEDFRATESEVGPNNTKLCVVKLPDPSTAGEAAFVGVTLQQQPQFFTMELQKSKESETIFELNQWKDTNTATKFGQMASPNSDEFVSKIDALLRGLGSTDNLNLNVGKSWNGAKKITLKTKAELGNKVLVYEKDQAIIYINPVDFIAEVRKSYYDQGSKNESEKNLFYVPLEDQQKLEKLIGSLPADQSTQLIALIDNNCSKSWEIWQVVKTLILDGKAAITDKRTANPVPFISYSDKGRAAGPTAGSGCASISFPDGYVFNKSSWIS